MYRFRERRIGGLDAEGQASSDSESPALRARVVAPRALALTMEAAIWVGWWSTPGYVRVDDVVVVVLVAVARLRTRDGRRSRDMMMASAMKSLKLVAMIRLRTIWTGLYVGSTKPLVLTQCSKVGCVTASTGGGGEGLEAIHCCITFERSCSVRAALDMTSRPAQEHH